MDRLHFQRNLHDPSRGKLLHYLLESIRAPMNFLLELEYLIVFQVTIMFVITIFIIKGKRDISLQQSAN